MSTYIPTTCILQLIFYCTCFLTHLLIYPSLYPSINPWPLTQVADILFMFLTFWYSICPKLVQQSQNWQGLNLFIRYNQPRQHMKETFTVYKTETIGWHINIFNQVSASRANILPWSEVGPKEKRKKVGLSIILHGSSVLQSWWSGVIQWTFHAAITSVQPTWAYLVWHQNYIGS